MSVFEILMLLSFGAAWPVSIHKSITSKSIQGKSVIFLYVIAFGYVMGIVHKLLNNYDFVIFLYVINLAMVVTDLVLYYRNKKLLESE